VLLVDDNAEARRALARFLEISGFTVEPVADGGSARTRLQSSPVPDVILTDMVLPDMDGRELGQAAEALVPRPLIALVTGWVFEHDLSDLKPWGIDLLFYKPLNAHELIDTLRSALANRP
jgi:CheY-like chemotaxis protein